MSMPSPTIAGLRCFNHGNREAVARCLECSRYYCRECVTAHGARVLCASCLSSTTVSSAPRRRAITAAWRAFQLTTGFLIIWVIAYMVGRGLLWLPSEFHEHMIWENDWFPQ